MVRILDQVYEAWKEKRPIAILHERFVARFDRSAQTHALADLFKSVLAQAARRSEELAGSELPAADVRISQLGGRSQACGK